MNLFINHSIDQENNEVIVTLFIDKRFGFEEFSNEFLSKNKRLSLEKEIKNYLINHLPNIKGGIVKVALGTIILTILPIQAFAETNPIQVEQSENTLQEDRTETNLIANQPINNYMESQIVYDPNLDKTEKDIVAKSQENQLENDTESLNSNVVSETYSTDIDTTINNTTTKESTYVVQTGDTLTRISKKFNTTVEQIKAANALTSDTIYVGQSLIIPSLDILTTIEVNDNSELSMKKGDSSPQVKDLKLKLAELGFDVSSNPNEDFGPKTEETVREFQSYYNLMPTGIVDQTTFNKLNTILSSPLSYWHQHDDVLAFKADLAKLGFVISNNPNSVYGSKTKDKVMDFQKYYGLRVNGIADEVTQRKIDELLQSQAETVPNTDVVFQQGDSGPEVRNIKLRLAKIGFATSNNPNEDFGPKTQDIVKDFQSYYELEQTGVVDKPTINKINLILSSPFQKWNQHEDILKLKNNLASLGFIVSDNPNNVFGRETENIVKSFQKHYGLKVNGIADEITINKVNELIQSQSEITPNHPTVYKQGDSGPEVKKIKLSLAKIGFATSKSPNEDFGPKTVDIVKDFQTYYSIEQTGELDQLTINKINTILSTPFQNWNQHEDILKLKEDLAILGFSVSDNPNNVFGSKTEETVKGFQRYYGLKENGIVDDVTWRKIDGLLQSVPSPFTRTLKLEDTGEDVKLFQEYLNDVGFKVVDQPTSYYGSLTENKVKEFQQYHGLNPTGIADSRTLNKLVTIRNGAVESINSFLISGKGYGHSVGMTQWGAYGMAKSGYTYDKILNYYYTGTKIGNSNTDNQNVRVLLVENTNNITLSSNQSYQIGDIVFQPGTKTTIQYQNGEYIIVNNDNIHKRKESFQILLSNNGLLFFDDKQYEGTFFISSTNEKLSFINHINVENYLKGVVPYEIIPSWDNSDLFKVQTLAARTYVMKEIQRNQNSKFDVYDTVRSQVYNGVPKDIPERYVLKINQAISDTRGEVILYNGGLIDAVYSASAGGHTVDAIDVWGNEIPYLVGKEDPFDTSNYSTNWWNYTITKQALERMYPDVGKIININIMEEKFGRPTKINIIGEKTSISISGSEFRQTLGLNNMLSNMYTIEGIR